MYIYHNDTRSHTVTYTHLVFLWRGPCSDPAVWRPCSWHSRWPPARNGNKLHCTHKENSSRTYPQYPHILYTPYSISYTHTPYQEGNHSTYAYIEHALYQIHVSIVLVKVCAWVHCQATCNFTRGHRLSQAPEIPRGFPSMVWVGTQVDGGPYCSCQLVLGLGNKEPYAISLGWTFRPPALY